MSQPARGDGVGTSDVEPAQMTPTGAAAWAASDRDRLLPRSW